MESSFEDRSSMRHTLLIQVLVSVQNFDVYTDDFNYMQCIIMSRATTQTVHAHAHAKHPQTVVILFILIVNSLTLPSELATCSRSTIVIGSARF